MNYQREVRIGLVLYGGVSLAVYENGVAQELHRAIRGDGVYALVKELIDSEIVVDIISGTSAGGVNGIMLAHALACKRSFGASADLWRKQGDIFALLRPEGDPETSSVLNSQYYQDKLSDCYATEMAPDPTAPEIEELDLFITGTDANGAISTAFDDEGHAIDIKNHRALFVLSVRSGRKDNVKEAGAENLATLSRLTSCFPVAFQPVRITAADTLFLKWGKLRDPAVFLDGGILNNKPFTSTIDAISRRVAEREVERLLIYVEPDPEVFAKPKPGSIPPSPSVAKAGYSALSLIPAYQSIAADLEAIEQHNERAGRIASVIEQVNSAEVSTDECFESAGVRAESKCNDAAYLASRFIQLRDRAVESIMNEPDGFRGYFEEPDVRRSGRILVESFGYWKGNPADTLDRYDVSFRMRRVKHLSDCLMRKAKTREVRQRAATVALAAWSTVNHYFKLYEIADWAMIEWLNRWDYPWRDLSRNYPEVDTLHDPQRARLLTSINERVWVAANERLGALMKLGAEVPSSQTHDAREGFYKQLASFTRGDGGPAPTEAAGNLLDRIDQSLKNALNALPPEERGLLRTEFCRFFEIDRQVFPILLGSGFESTDPMRVVRFSPKDAQRGNSCGRPENKVCGSALGAFGGFLKMSWRANDIMMGRFDGSCQLLECLLTKQRLADLPAGRKFDAMRLRAFFRKASNEDLTVLAQNLNTYLVDPSTATQQSWSDLLDALVKAAHADIEDEEWPRVNECALLQEYAWGRYSPPAGSGKTKKRWMQAHKKPDELLVDVAADAIARRSLSPFQPGSVAGKPFLEEMPTSVLQELGFQAAIRLNHSLIGSIGSEETQKKITGNRLYGWLSGVLNLLYRWAHMLRTQPESVIVLNTAIPVACIAVFVVTAGLWISFQFNWRLPAALLGASGAVFLIWQTRFRK